MPSTIKEWWQEAAAFAEKVGEFVPAVTSGTTDPATFETRLSSCLSCPGRAERNPREPGSYVAADGLRYCRECDCGENLFSRLDRKLWFRELPCPLGRPGFVNEGHHMPTGSSVTFDPSFKPCPTCKDAKPAQEPVNVGDKVCISAWLPGDKPDLRPWTVTRVSGEAVDVERSRRWFAWLWKRGAPERVTVSRAATSPASKPRILVHHAGR